MTKWPAWLTSLKIGKMMQNSLFFSTWSYMIYTTHLLFQIGLLIPWRMHLWTCSSITWQTKIWKVSNQRDQQVIACISQNLFIPVVYKIAMMTWKSPIHYPEDLLVAHFGDTRTGSLLEAFFAAISSKRFHVISRLKFMSFSCTSSSLNLSKHSSKSSGSTSENILRTFSVKLWTAWFQWLLAFFSNAVKMIGRITLRFCLIRFSIWSLFHKNNALSATWILKKNKLHYLQNYHKFKHIQYSSFIFK